MAQRTLHLLSSDLADAEAVLAPPGSVAMPREIAEWMAVTGGSGTTSVTGESPIVSGACIYA